MLGRLKQNPYRAGSGPKASRNRLVESTVKGSGFVERELYDPRKDPQENVNMAGRPESAEKMKELARRLHAGWRAALPPK